MRGDMNGDGVCISLALAPASIPGPCPGPGPPGTTGQWAAAPGRGHRRYPPPRPPAQQSDPSCPIATSTSSHTNTAITANIFWGLKIFETNSLRKSTKLNSSKSEHFCENFHYRVILTEPEFKQDTLFKLTAPEQKSVLEIEDESKYWGNTNNPNQLFVQINYPWFPFSIKIYYHKIRIMVVRNEVGAF